MRDLRLSLWSIRKNRCPSWGSIPQGLLAGSAQCIAVDHYHPQFLTRIEQATSSSWHSKNRDAQRAGIAPRFAALIALGIAASICLAIQQRVRRLLHTAPH